MAPCVGDFRVQAIADEVTAMQTFFLDMKDGVRPRYPVEWAISIVFAGFASTAREG
jgi:hypothetical protein